MFTVNYHLQDDQVFTMLTANWPTPLLAPEGPVDSNIGPIGTNVLVAVCPLEKIACTVEGSLADVRQNISPPGEPPAQNNAEDTKCSKWALN